MAGDERVRHCTLCSLNVYNFAEMTADEVRQLLMQTEGRVCARMYRRADGTVLTRDCPTGLRAVRRRVARVAASLFAAVLSVASFACGTTSRSKTPKSRVQLEVERVATQQPAVLQGIVRDATGVPLPGVSITVRDETSKREIVVATDEKGVFHIASLNEGIYRIDAILVGLEPARIEHVHLKASEVTRANVVLHFEAMVESLIVGAIAVDPMASSGISMTFSQDFIDNMPR
jgi:hypothetical protein